MNEKREDNEMISAQDIELMLPWYVNGTLSADERAQVDRYMRENPDMARQLDLVREEMDVTISENEALNPARSGALDRLLTRIDADDGPQREKDGGVAQYGWLSGWLSAFNAPALRLAAVGAAVVIIAQAVVIGSLTTGGDRPTTYETASGPSAVEDVVTDGTRLLVAFADTATAAQITTLLSEIEATVISGPRAGGFFEVRLSGAALSAEDAGKLVSDLQKRQDILKFVSVSE